MLHAKQQSVGRKWKSYVEKCFEWRVETFFRGFLADKILKKMRNMQGAHVHIKFP